MLTRVQWWVLRLRANGLPPSEVGLYLGMGRTGVWRHSSDAFRRLGATNLVEAFLALGWLKPPDPDDEERA